MKKIPCQILDRDFGMVIMPPTIPRFIVTVQHDGMCDEIFRDLFYQRKKFSKQDVRVMPVAMDIFRQASPFVSVIYNKFDRSLLDTNRYPDDAYVDPEMKKRFDSYHQEVSNLIKSVTAAYGESRSCLIDLHGFTRQPSYEIHPGPYDVILGTGNLRTVNFKSNGRGDNEEYQKWASLDKKLAAHISDEGLEVFLPQAETVRKDPLYIDYYNGGYLIRHHCNSGVAAAIQVELSRGMREFKNSTTPEGLLKRKKFVTAICTLIKEVCQ